MAKAILERRQPAEPCEPGSPAWEASSALDEATAILESKLLNLDSDLAHAGYTLLKSAAERCSAALNAPTEDSFNEISVRLAEAVAVLDAFLGVRDDQATWGVLRLMKWGKRTIDDEVLPSISAGALEVQS